MLTQHFFQVHFALTSKDISAFSDRSSNQQSENKACNLSMRLAELLQFTNMFLEEKCRVHDKVGLPYLYSLSKLSPSTNGALVYTSSDFFFFPLSCFIHSLFLLLLKSRFFFFLNFGPPYKRFTVDNRTVTLLKSRQIKFFKGEQVLSVGDSFCLGGNLGSD